MPYLYIMPYLYMAMLAALLAGCDATSSSNSPLRVAWSTPAGAEVDQAEGQPVTDGERFYITRRRGVAAFRVDDGRLVWTSDPLQTFAPLYTALSGGRILVTDDEAVALDAETGRETWRVSLGASGEITEHGADASTFYIGARDRVVRALDAATGAERWRADIGSAWWGGIVTGVSVADGVAYAAVERTYPPNGFRSQGVVVALDAQTGRELWRYENGDGSTTVSVNRAPTIATDLILVADLRGRAFIALDRQTGQERWRVRTREGYIGPFQSPVVADGGADGLAYASAPDIHVRAIELATGRVRWSREPAPDASGSLYHAVCGSIVLNNAVGVVYASDRQTGRTVSRDLFRQDLATSGFAVAERRAFFVGRRTVNAVDCP